MKTRKTLAGTIGERALARPNVNKESTIDDWHKVWFEEAEKLKQEMIDEGLPITAQTIQDLIDWNKKVIGDK